jgi:formate dehydrogenase iron-sulfur subunit
MADMKRLSGVDIVTRRKGLLITPEVCTGCRGCQTACKEWNKLPAEKTKNRGSYENPPDLSQNLYNRIQFVEVSGEAKKQMDWLFVSRRCMHCGDAGCMDICPAPGAIFRNGDGVVGFDKDKCIGCKLCQAGCPFDVPRYDANDRVSKCHLCDDRIPHGLEPACSKVCPTDAIRYGDRVNLVRTAKAEGYQTVYGETDLAGLGVLYAFREKPEYYGFTSSPDLPASVSFWRGFLKPLALIGLGASVATALTHYISVGPSEHEEEEKGGEEQ